MQNGNLIHSLSYAHAMEDIVFEQLQTNSRTLPIPSVGFGIRALAVACAAAALVVGVLAAGGLPAAWAQAQSGCEVNDLGTLGGGGQSEL